MIKLPGIQNLISQVDEMPAMSDWFLQRQTLTSQTFEVMHRILNGVVPRDWIVVTGMLEQDRHKKERQLWTTSLIVEVVGFNTVRTMSGRLYRLVGSPRVDLMAAMFSADLCGQLRRGLAVGWIAVIQAELLKDISRTSTVSSNASIVSHPTRQSLTLAPLTSLTSNASDDCFKCRFPSCSQSFSRLYQLTSHEAAHQGFQHLCRFCSQPFPNHHSLHHHMHSIHPLNRMFTCRTCFCAFERHDAYVRHLESRSHDPRPLTEDMKVQLEVMWDQFEMEYRRIGSQDGECGGSGSPIIPALVHRTTAETHLVSPCLTPVAVRTASKRGADDGEALEARKHSRIANNEFMADALNALAFVAASCVEE